MRRFLSRFTKQSTETECKLHNVTRFPNIKANEHCHDCNAPMCYLCAGQHLDAKHHVQSSKRETSSSIDSSQILHQSSTGRLECRGSSEMGLEGVQVPMWGSHHCDVRSMWNSHLLKRMPQSARPLPLPGKLHDS